MFIAFSSVILHTNLIEICKLKILFIARNEEKINFNLARKFHHGSFFHTLEVINISRN